MSAAPFRYLIIRVAVARHSFYSLSCHTVCLFIFRLNNIVDFFPSVFGHKSFRAHLSMQAHHLLRLLFYVVCLYELILVMLYNFFSVVIIAITREVEKEKIIINFSPENVWIDGRNIFH